MKNKARILILSLALACPALANWHPPQSDMRRIEPPFRRLAARPSQFAFVMHCIFPLWY